MLFKIFKTLLKNNTEIVLWYSDYIDDLEIVNTEELLRIILDGIDDSMCEIYSWYKPKNICL